LQQFQSTFSTGHNLGNPRSAHHASQHGTFGLHSSVSEGKKSLDVSIPLALLPEFHESRRSGFLTVSCKYPAAKEQTAELPTHRTSQRWPECVQCTFIMTSKPIAFHWPHMHSSLCEDRPLRWQVQSVTAFSIKNGVPLKSMTLGTASFKVLAPLQSRTVPK
jgi:hypothetical protein